MVGAVKRLVKTLAPARWYDPWRQTSYSQDGEDRILARVFERRAAGRYVDVGAHHPRRFSNTYLLYRQGWSGINIDATPGSMQAFRRERPRDINLEMGVAEQPGMLQFHLFDEPALNTFDAALAKRLHTQGPYRLQKVCNIPVAPLRDVLRRHLPAGAAVDLLTIDVEGVDLAVLRSNDWSACRPTVVVVEDGADLGGLLGDAKTQLLAAQGYQLFAKTATSAFFRAAA